MGFTMNVIVVLTFFLFCCCALKLVKSQVKHFDKEDYLQDKTELVHKDGYCMMYGECAINNYNEKKVNCFYNKEAKRLRNKEGLQILQQLCPYLYKGNRDTITCCNTNQLITLKNNMRLPLQYLSLCPSCYRNFIALFCEMTCSPNQSKFTTAVRVGQGYDPKLNIRPINGTQSNYVSVLGYNVNNQYADSMFNSCVHVTSPSIVPSVQVLCGPYGHECTAQKWITYMNDIQNGQAAYDVQVNFSYTAMVGMNYKTQSCQEKSYAGEPACVCSDCPPSCSAPSTPHSMEKYFKKTFGPHYRLEQLNITAPHSSRSIYEPFTTSTDPADQKQIPFGPILQKSNLHKILTLQRSINQLTAQYNGKTITLQDICFKAPDNKTCIVLSPLNYFQNNRTNLNKEAFVAGFFLASDYHDHLMSCVQHPNTNDDRTYLHMSCLGTFNGPIIPWVVLGGYDAYNYLNATVATVTFPVMGYPDDLQSLNESLAWEKEFFSFMENYTSHAGDLSVKYAAGFHFELREN